MRSSTKTKTRTGSEVKDPQKKAVLEMVWEEIINDPDISSSTLYDKAREIAPDLIDELSVRQFHARYPLQVHKKIAQSRKKKAKAGGNGKTEVEGEDDNVKRIRVAKPSEIKREHLRRLFLKYAEAAAGAEGVAEAFAVMREADNYVDEAIKTLGVSSS